MLGLVRFVSRRAAETCSLEVTPIRPLFTVHAGEFLVGELIEQTFPSLNVWVPAKDTGVDLLVTDVGARNAISLQVKLSRDYRLPEATEPFDRSLVATMISVMIRDRRVTLLPRRRDQYAAAAGHGQRLDRHARVAEVQ